MTFNKFSGEFGSFQPFDPLNPFDPFEPLDPRRRRPMPKRPFDIKWEVASKGET